MSDTRIETVTRMAREVEELEASAAAPIALRRGLSSRMGMLAPLLALAACAGIAVGILIFPSSPSPTPASPEKNGTPIVALPAPLPPSVQPVSDESAIVLAIVEDTDGQVKCVSWTRHDASSPGHHALAPLTPADLARQICRADCVPGPHWLLAAKVSGPRRLLPSGEEEVQALAQCIMGEHVERCVDGPTVGTASCLPAGTRVVVERRSVAGP